MNPAVGEMWQALQDTPFPEDIPAELDDAVNVELLDSTAREAIQAYVLAGSLDSVSDGKLRACLQELSEIVPHLEGDSRTYFTRMRDVAELIVGRKARPGLPPGLMG
ncbi:MAG TPA: hypothetical protein VE967_12045 [Gemmatimonadaceae bacterium]|nr:hypothetical protein [Gemmatimonadaceae bacterium]